MKTIVNKIITILLVFVPLFISAQRVLLDKPVRAGELTLFPEVKNESNYYYLPDKPKLALHKDDTPQFSFLRYVKNQKTTAEANTAISESSFGGGIIHALVELKVTDEQIKEAQRSLRRIDGDAKIIGPVIFKSGTVMLISSVAQKNGEFTKQVVGLGSAPILENQRSAVSVQLNKLGSKILWESFKTPTPDFSIHFEMEVEGYLSPKEVKIEADYERIYKHKAFEAAAVTPILSGEIKMTFEDLFDSGAIKVTQIGDDEQLEKMKETAYNQLTNLIFDKIGGTGIPQLNKLVSTGKKSMLDRATAMLDKSRKEVKTENQKIDKQQQTKSKKETKIRAKSVPRANQKRINKGLSKIKAPTGKQKKATIAPAKSNSETAKNKKADIPKKQAMPSLAIAVSYQMKKIKRKGTYRVDLRKYTQTTRPMSFTYNLGNVKSICADCFREVNLDDDLMKQREINASLGGIVSDDFKYVNFVNVLLRKKHQDGSETIDEIKIDRSSFNSTGNFYKMVYGWKGDTNRNQWLNYEYKTLWSVFGNQKFESDWQKNNFGSISLEPPVVKKPIYIEIDEEFIKDENIKAIEIKIYTVINQKEVINSMNFKTNKGELSQTMEVILPRDNEDYSYEITYFITRKDPVKSSKHASNYGRIDVDRFYN